MQGSALGGKQVIQMRQTGEKRRLTPTWMVVTVDGRITPSTSASEPRVRAFHARGSSAICPLSSAPFRLHIPPVGLVICGLTPSPRGVSLPHATAWVSRFCSVTPSNHMHMTVRTSAYPRRYSRPSLLAGSLTTRHTVGTYSRRCVRARVALRRSQFPWFASVGRCFPPGFCGSAGRSVASAAGALSCALLAPARQPLALGDGHDGSTHLRLRCP